MHYKLIVVGLDAFYLDIHFQYNGFLYGILLLSVVRMLQVSATIFINIEGYVYTSVFNALK